MKVSIDGADHTSRELRKIHKRLEPKQQKWIFASLLDDMYVIQRAGWNRRFAAKRDKESRPGNPPRYMHQSGALESSATGPKGPYSYFQVTDDFALLSLKGPAVGLAMAHHRRGREVITAPSKRDERYLVETMGRFILTGEGRSGR
jgi:hypothetical protein